MSVYLNPLRGAHNLRPLRTDQGVDYYARAFSPIYPLGWCKITRVSMVSGWPGGGVVQYVLLDGTHAGEEVYVAEFIRPRPLLKVGDEVHPQRWLAWFRIPTRAGLQGIETGFIRPHTHEPCSSDTSGRPTEGGIRFNRLLRSVGCPTATNFGPGPDNCPCGVWNL